MKKFWLSFLCLVFLANCGDPLNSRLFGDNPKTKTGAAGEEEKDKLGGLGGGGAGPYGNEPENTCQHLDAINPSKFLSSYPGPCIFYACKDPMYAEYAQTMEYKDYVAKYGGEIIHDQDKCKDDNPKDDVCNHPDALNYKKPGECHFQACAKPEYQEYLLYLEFQRYIQAAGSGKLTPQNSLCKNKPGTAGCTDSKAMNYDKEATVENGSCKYGFCDDPNYEEYTASWNKEILTHINPYAEKWKKTLKQLLGYNRCRTPKDKEKCKDKRAVNYNKPEICIFKVCTMKDYEEYDFYLEIYDYLLSHPEAGRIEEDIKLCKKKKINRGCLQKSAQNYKNDPKINKEDGSCLWDVCLNPKYKEYHQQDNLSLLEIIEQYSIDNSIDIYDLVRKSTCKKKNDDDKKRGCTDKEAENYNPKATEDDKSCKYAVCLDCHYLEYSKPENKAVIKAMHKYSAKYKIPVKSLIIRSTCKTKKDHKGCMIPTAINYDREATIESGDCKFKACISCKAHEYPEWSQDLKDIIYDYYYYLKNKYKKYPHVTVYNTCKKGHFIIRTLLDGKCFQNQNSVNVKMKVNGKEVLDNILTPSQFEAEGVHVKKGDKYELEIDADGEKTQFYSIDGQGLKVGGKVEGHIKHVIKCEE
ncbi:MAG: hypothetical protein H6621_07040 [Halobacteriovoraceae bacterium]|nr:hypothetical protein [Halobacteriovoraceae bacterium]